jgi:membrane protein DedA with SNARE-associated domain
VHIGELISHLITTVPSWAVYACVGAIIMIESLGIPMPGELALVGATLLTLHPDAEVRWEVVAACASVGAIVGDSIGYAIGRRGGRPLFAWAGRKFPKHFGPAHIAAAERAFDRWGMWAVFFGRFILLLRILAGPLAGALRMPYHRFLIANALGGVVWATGTAALVHFVGAVVERWLSGIALWGLVAALLFGLGFTWYLKRRTDRAARELESS